MCETAGLQPGCLSFGRGDGGRGIVYRMFLADPGHFRYTISYIMLPIDFFGKGVLLMARKSFGAAERTEPMQMQALKLQELQSAFRSAFRRACSDA